MLWVMRLWEPVVGWQLMDRLRAAGLLGRFESRLTEVNRELPKRSYEETVGVVRGEFMAELEALEAAKAEGKRDGPAAGWIDALSSEERAEFMARGASAEVEVRWVAAHLNTDWAQMRVMDAPSAAAWNMLVNARRNVTRENEFFDKIYKPVLQKQVGVVGGAGELDGGHVVEVIDRLVALKAKVEGGG